MNGAVLASNNIEDMLDLQLDLLQYQRIKIVVKIIHQDTEKPLNGEINDAYLMVHRDMLMVDVLNTIMARIVRDQVRFSFRSYYDI